MNIELIRPFLRKALGKGLYGAGASIADNTSILAREGYNTWRQLRRCSAGVEGAEPTAINFKGLSHPIWLRPGTADAATVVSTVVRKEYGLVEPPGVPLWMVDAGAYIGDTSAYFLSRFPHLKVVALEPNSVNYKAALRNLSPYEGRAVLLKQGLYSRDAVLHFSGGETAGRIGEKGDTSVECVSIQSLLTKYAIPYLDILKMDIEGVEDEVFSAAPEAWLPLVGLIIVEIHSPEKLEIIRKILDRHHFTMSRYRSVWYCINGARTA